VTPALLQVLRHRPEHGPPPQLGALPPADLVAQAERHALCSVLAHVLQSPPGSQPLPEPHATTLREGALRVAGAALRMKALLLTALDALAEDGLCPTLLKGYAFGARYYPSPLHRPGTDVDLMVTRAELPGAVAALERLGLRQVGTDPLDDHHHVALHGEAGTVDVHYRATSGFGAPGPLDALQLQTQPGTLEGRAVRYLLPEHECAYLGIHAAQHLFGRLSWLYDLRQLLDAQPGLDWREVQGRARAAGMQRALYAALHAAVTAFDARVPPDALEALCPSRRHRALVHALFTPERLVSARLARSRMSAFGIRALLTDDPGRLFRHVADGAAREWRRRRLGAAAPR
jgi:hypothetical protein